MEPARKKARILIVDDEAMIAEILARYAREEGFEAECAANGLDALQKLADDHFDIVVTDLVMPKLDGPGLMASISQMNPAPQLIAITGHASMEAAIDCLRKGAADFLVKPFDVNEFLESIKKVLARATNAVYRDPDWNEVCERYGLTSRQCEVLAAFYRTGKSNRDLGDELFLSPHTVKSHLRAAFEKIGVQSRSQLIRALQG